MYKKVRIYHGVLFFFFVFILISILVKGAGYNERINTLFQVSSFLFGIFVAFSIANSQARFNNISETLKEDEGILLFIYYSSSVFELATVDKIRELLDKYLQAQIDFYLTDFKYSNEAFVELLNYVVKLQPKTESQENVHATMVSLLGESFKNRKTVETLVQQPMLKFEWISILSLLSIILFSIFFINDGSIISIVTSVLLSTSAVVLVFVLRDLDNLRWKERDWVWEPLGELFVRLGLLPYFPKSTVDSGRVRLKKGQKVRIVEYPDPYPEMAGKNIRVV